MTNQEKRTATETELRSCWECGGRGAFITAGKRTAVICEECECVTKSQTDWTRAVVDWIIGDVIRKDGEK